MRLTKARIRSYRSIRDTGWFDIEEKKTIFVGPNEAGKTAVLQALQQLNAPDGVAPFDPLRDYPRAEYNNISSGREKPEDIVVVEGRFALSDADRAKLPDNYQNVLYSFSRKLDGSAIHSILDGPDIPSFGDLKKDFIRLCTHGDKQFKKISADDIDEEKPSLKFSKLTGDWQEDHKIYESKSMALATFLDETLSYIDEENQTENNRYDRLKSSVNTYKTRTQVLKILESRKPVFVLFSNYFRVRPLIHLDHLATRIEQELLDDTQYDFGNLCLMKLLGFSARELSNLGKAAEPAANNPEALQEYQDQLDKRSYQLNAASVKLTDEITKAWMPKKGRAEADKLRVSADGQYLKVVVEDDLGVEIELDQRSEGFQWLVSFFVVFFAEADDLHENAILLLDEPGLSLHGLKQRDFRKTISRLAEKNQTLYTTHSPFLVGPDELDMVRVVEMLNRREGTKVHTKISAGDSAALLPLQEALGYDLAQSLFAQKKNLILEGLTDYWYLEAISQMLESAGIVVLDQKISLITANAASKVVYFATILHAHRLKVAALLDSDAAGDQAAQQDTLVHALGNKKILRTKDVYSGSVSNPEIEDILRETLVAIAKEDLGWDIVSTAVAQPGRPIINIFDTEVGKFSKYKLAKAFLRWSRNHEARDLTDKERDQWTRLINKINNALK